jgi:membrane protein DedA with SNARE-associated domain
VTLGLTLGNAIGYLLGSVFGTPVVERLVSADGAARARGLVERRRGAVMLAATRPIPVTSEAVMLILGAARAPVRRTLFICALANLGVAIVFAAAGSLAEGPAAIPLLLLGAVGVPAAAMLAASGVLGQDLPGENRSEEAEDAG